LESLTEAVFSEISRQKGVFDVIVSISKPHALRFTDNVSVKISDKERNSLAILSIGSNIDPLNSINKSLELLHTKVNVLFVAELVPTKAIGMADQPDFLNSLAVIKTNLSSQALKAVLLDIEKLCGRVRGENKNAARTIDLDLIRWGSHTFDEADLRYPFFQEMLSKFVPGLIAS
jgi:2-amino-4-hydroxy-6-hydroxymethyldihydropteridine diphosphokinase